MTSILRLVAPGLLILGLAAVMRLGLDAACDELGSPAPSPSALASR